MFSTALMLAQAGSHPFAAAVPWWQVLLDNALGLTIVLIFVTAIVVALINAWRRDKCLKLLHDYHVTYLTMAGTPTWGDLVVYSRGIELRFDAPYITRDGTTKSSSLIYDDDLANCLAFCRVRSALTRNEHRARARQVTRSFKPGIVRRTTRLARNIANTLRDAIAKSITAILGQLAKARPGMAGGQGEMEQLGKTVLGTVENAYEPMLEKHIGRPVVLQLANPAAPDRPPVELPGYLVDYTDKYVAVFNVEHTVDEARQLEIRGPFDEPGLSVALDDDSVTIRAAGPEVVVVRRATLGARQFNLDVVLLPGCRLTLTRDPNEPLAVSIDRGGRVDIVCPRTLARVCFGSDRPTRADVEVGRQGLVPKEAQDDGAVQPA